MKRDLRLIVCGGRDFADWEFIYATLDYLHATRGIVEIIHGDCPTGADHYANAWAILRGVDVTPVPADWGKHGRAAGPMRNGVMARMGADGCVAFAGGNGTADMRRQAGDNGVAVWCPVRAVG